MKEINVASYNVRIDTDADGDWSWDYRKNEVIRLITYHDWDVFGVQEISPKQLKDLSSIDGYSIYHAEREGNQDGEGLGVFYKTEQFSCLDKGFFWLSETPDKPSIHPTAGCKRIAIWLILKEKETGLEFLLINTHLDHMSDVARKDGISIIMDVLKEKIDINKTILLGDFNALQDEIVHETLKEIFIYPQNNKKVFNYGPQGTFNDFIYNVKWSELEEIDYILYKGLNCLKKAVLTDSCNQRFPSDHFPVVATFII